jgi:hypothetical protein
MAPDKTFRRERLIAPRVRSERAAARLLVQMRELGSERVLPTDVWMTAAQLPRVIAAENGSR